MMKKLIFLFIFVVTIISCNENNIQEEVKVQEITVQFNETNNNGKISIKFSDIIEDSRCPEEMNINCVWNGRAVIKLVLNNVEENIIAIGNLQAGNPNKYANTVEHQGYLIQLINLKPKASVEEIENKDYIATLKIDKI